MKDPETPLPNRLNSVNDAVSLPSIPFIYFSSVFLFSFLLGRLESPRAANFVTAKKPEKLQETPREILHSE